MFSQISSLLGMVPRKAEPPTGETQSGDDFAEVFANTQRDGAEDTFDQAGLKSESLDDAKEAKTEGAEQSSDSAKNESTDEIGQDKDSETLRSSPQSEETLEDDFEFRRGLNSGHPPSNSGQSTIGFEPLAPGTKFESERSTLSSPENGSQVTNSLDQSPSETSPHRIFGARGEGSMIALTNGGQTALDETRGLVKSEARSGLKETSAPTNSPENKTLSADINERVGFVQGDGSFQTGRQANLGTTAQPNPNFQKSGSFENFRSGKAENSRAAPVVAGKATQEEFRALLRHELSSNHKSNAAVPPEGASRLNVSEFIESRPLFQNIDGSTEQAKGAQPSNQDGDSDAVLHRQTNSDLPLRTSPKQATETQLISTVRSERVAAHVSKPTEALSFELPESERLRGAATMQSDLRLANPMKGAEEAGHVADRWRTTTTDEGLYKASSLPERPIAETGQRVTERNFHETQTATLLGGSENDLPSASFGKGQLRPNPDAQVGPQHKSLSVAGDNKVSVRDHLTDRETLLPEPEPAPLIKTVVSKSTRTSPANLAMQESVPVVQSVSDRFQGVNAPFIEDADVSVSVDFVSSPSDVKAVLSTAPASVSARPEVQQVLRQVIEVLPKLSERAVEIRLSPEELGLVRLQLVQGEQGLTVHVHADRAETLDMLKRNIDQLARDLAHSGHDAQGFSFSGGSDQQNAHAEPTVLEDRPERQDMTPSHPTIADASGVDIRI